MTIQPGWEQSPAQQCARDIFQDFVVYNSEFRSITQRARTRFERRQWIESRRDAVERIELYDRHVNATVSRLETVLGTTVHDRAFWADTKRYYSLLITSYRDLEFTKTFFSSVTRRLFATVGVDPEIEFVASDSRPLEELTAPLHCQSYTNDGSPAHLFAILLADYPFEVAYRNLRLSGSYIADRVTAASAADGEGDIERVEMIHPVFFRDTRAYLVGRVTCANGTTPLMIALENTPAGIVVDAVITSENEISVIFGFARSYFHVDLESVASAVLFIRTLLPRKSVAELFTMLGRAKQGKTEIFRELMRHMDQSTDRFENAAVDRGMVMIVFTLPSYRMVFKVIRDRFAQPKNLVRQDVLDKYELVFKHDRAGRLVDAQEFGKLEFPRARFDETLLEELLSEASATVRLVGERVVISHLYVERRLSPLNQYVGEADPEAADAALQEYGQAIRDLACTNIFPGDLLLKNFGVTRHGRVIFYDYDELCLVTDCRFRELPQASTPEEEMAAEAWFYVADNDVFPEQFIGFLGLGDSLREGFLKAHADLLTPEFWREMKKRHLAGEVIELLPYRGVEEHP